MVWPALAATLILLVALHKTPLHESQLRQELKTALPVQAVDFVQSHGFEGPVFNDYTWGGYLIWRLHQPVSLDGRAALYGDKRIDHVDSLWKGKAGWIDDLELARARFIIGPSEAPLSQLLRHDPRYRVIYEDKLATVLVHRER